MVYRALGVMMDKEVFSIAFAEFQENAGSWSYELKESANYKPQADPRFITRFMEEKSLQFKAAVITAHSMPDAKFFNGAIIAAETGLPVITDLSALDKALGGNGDFLNMAAQKLNIDENHLTDEIKAICIAFMGILRWREEYNFLSSITGARRNSIGGAIWLGQEA